MDILAWDFQALARIAKLEMKRGSQAKDLLSKKRKWLFAG